ncbi:hypothetical protein [Paraburkholderia caffeinilytica]|uniref:hypothetical protein n=1 Tax=Paraburkholderia caffeinilytica TaxID=1761016 RepID=UPI003DA17962
MDHAHNACQPPVARDGAVSASDTNALQRRFDQAEADVRRLKERLRDKDRQLAEMGKALLRTVALHHAIEERQEDELESLRAMVPAWKTCQCVCDGPSEYSDGITVHLPFITEILSGMFDVMHTFWSGYDENNPPKSSVVAHAIDERLNLRAQPDGEASRSGQTYASAIRPDWLKEADSRHHVRPRT